MKPWDAEAGQQALGHPLLQVQVNRVLGEHTGVFEDDRPDRCFATPFGELLIPSSAECGAYPASRPSSGRSRHGGRAGGKVQTGRPPRPSSRASGLGTQQFQASRKVHRGTALASKPIQLRDVSRRFWQRSICAVRSSWRSRAASSSSSVTRFLLGVEVCLFDLARQSFCIAVTDALLEPTLDVVVDDLREASELFLDGLGLFDKDLEHAVLHALRQDEVVAADLGGRLELSVDAAVALLDATGIPGQVEVEEVRAMGLEVQALPGGVGGEQDAQRILRRIGVEPALDLLASSAAR